MKGTTQIMDNDDGRKRDLRPGDVVVNPHKTPFAFIIRRRKHDDTGWWLVGDGGFNDSVLDDYEVVGRLTPEGRRAVGCAE